MCESGSPSLAARKRAAEAPVGLRIAATIVSVPITSLTRAAYHITGDVSLAAAAVGWASAHRFLCPVEVMVGLSPLYGFVLLFLRALAPTVTRLRWLVALTIHAAIACTA